MFVDHFLKTKKEQKNLNNQNIENDLAKDIQVFVIIWFMKILKTWIEKQLLIKYLILLIIQILMANNVDLHHWLSFFFEKKSSDLKRRNTNCLTKALHKPVIRKF